MLPARITDNSFDTFADIFPPSRKVVVERTTIHHKRMTSWLSPPFQGKSPCRNSGSVPNPWNTPLNVLRGKTCSVYNSIGKCVAKDSDPMTCVLCLFWEIPYAAKQAGISHAY